MPVKHIPEGYHSVTPYLIVQGVTRIIEFLKQAFDAKETERMQTPDGRIMHAELKIGDSPIMFGEPLPTGDFKHMPSTLYVYVSDTDATYKRALSAGATCLMEPADQFYGDRNAGVKDVAGNIWWIATHIEDISRDELIRRAEARAKQQAGS